MLKKKKFLFICQIDGPTNGAQTYNKLIYKYLKKKYKRNLNYLDTNLSSNVFDTGKINISKIFHYFKFYINFLIKFIKYDVFYIVPGNTFLGIFRFYFIILILKFFNKNIIFHHHGYGVYYYIKNYKFLKKIFLGKNNINLVLTKDLKKKFLKIDAKFKINVMNNFYPLKFKKKKKNNKILKILYFSNHMKEKGFEMYVKLAKLFNQFEFIICGGQNNWSRKILKNNYSKNIKNLGFVSEKKKEEIYSNSDIYILPTYYKTEGVPATILDALSSSCAIITTFHNGIPEAVGDSALFVKKNNFVDLCKKFKFLTSSKFILKKYQNKVRSHYIKNKHLKSEYLKKIEKVFHINE